MARGIVTCTGQTINIGDTVRTADGQILTVQGAAIGMTFHDAERCTVVPKGTKPTKPTKADEESAAQGASGNAAQGASSEARQTHTSDCVIWGT